MFIIFIFISIHSFQPTFDRILSDYRMIEESPYFKESNYLWEDILYSYCQEDISKNIREGLSDTSKYSRASMTKAAHLAWAVYDSRDLIGDRRISAWLGNMYPYVKNIELIYEMPEPTKMLYGYQSAYILDAGCRWSAFYPMLDTTAYLWLNLLRGSKSITELAEMTGVERNDIALFCLSLLRFDVFELSNEKKNEIYEVIILPDTIGIVTGVGFFFIGE